MKAGLKRLLALALLLTVPLGVLPDTAWSQASPFPIAITQTLQNAAAATGNGTVMPTGQLSVMTFQASGTFSGTVTYEGSNDNTNWNSLTCYTLDSATSSSTTTTTNLLRCNVTGISGVRARVSSYSSGSITVVGNGTSAFANVRDTVSPPVTIAGQIRSTQATAPTCGTATTATCAVTGTDSAVRGLISNPPNWANTVVVTFTTAWATTPSCTAAWDGTVTYGYYMQAVTPTTTTATLKLGGAVGGASPVSVAKGWSPGDAFSLTCVGTS